MVLHERALTLNPNLALAWGLSALSYAYAGQLDEAQSRVQRAKRLSPLDPHAYLVETAIATIALLQHDHPTAISAGRELSQMHPGWADGCKPYLAALGHAGLETEAMQLHERLQAIRPGVSISALTQSQPFQRAQDWAVFTEGLRRAGLPD